MDAQDIREGLRRAPTETAFGGDSETGKVAARGACSLHRTLAPVMKMD